MWVYGKHLIDTTDFDILSAIYLFLFFYLTTFISPASEVLRTAWCNLEY